MKKAVFLDRDGTLNEDPGYLSDPAKVRILPGVREALALLRAQGFSLVVVSNQSGIARGLITPEQLKAVNARIGTELGLDLFYECIHGPDSTCACRKPQPGLLVQAAKDLGITLSKSYVVGDRLRDVQAGLAAGCAAGVFLSYGDPNPEWQQGSKSLEPGRFRVEQSLLDAAQWIVAAAGS